MKGSADPPVSVKNRPPYERPGIRHRHVMSPAAFEVSAWQCMKIGAGPVPIETSEGWLLFYHGVLRSCNGYVYAFGSALLDLEEPWKVTARSGPYLISPREPYECMGDVPNVTFREGGHSGWLNDNLKEAENAPEFYGVTAKWTFNGKWDPEQRIRDLWNVLAY